MKVAAIMTAPVVHVTGDMPFDEAAEAMDAAGVRHLPVVEDGRLVGVLSERELLDATGWLPRAVLDVLEAPRGVVRDVMHAPVVTVSPDDSLVTASLRLVEWGVGCLPVLDETELVGIVTEHDVLDAYAEACGRSLMAVRSDPNVAEVMTVDVASTELDAPADEALAFLRERAFRHLPIVDGERLVGIVSERDLRMCAGRGQLEETPVRELCCGELHTVAAGTSLSAAARAMVEHRIGALPVVEGERLVGILAARDVLRHCVTAFAAEGRAVRT